MHTQYLYLEEVKEQITKENKIPNILNYTIWRNKCSRPNTNNK